MTYYPQHNQNIGFVDNFTPYPPTGPYFPNSSQLRMNVGDYPGQQGFQNHGGYPNPGGYPGPSTGSPPGGFMPQVSPTPQISPTAPDLSQMQKIPGYETITFKEEILPPPIIPAWKPDQQQTRQIDSLPGLSEEEVRSAATQFVSEHCCYGSAPVREMIFTEIQMMSAFHYKLETFGEKRESAWRFVPYTGQPIDGPMNGPAPAAWDVVALPPEYFKNGKSKMEVPHTAFVKPCHTCVGNSRVRCDSCFGNGRNECTWCKGRGRRTQFDRDEICSPCNGTGYKKCFTCDGSGQVKCQTCNGKGNLKGYVELIVTWTNHIDDYISETSSMPKELVREVTGKIAYEEENPRVWPLMNAPDQAVVNASSEYINKHNSAFPNERILKQRQVIRLIPIGQVRYVWKEKGGEFYVYGYEKKVHFADYPQKCCCCSII
ncbi:protein SSUH2 homolog [Uloborus diversus]|uniref:protein SSUH2 homolog n=1 Tax=Uloborus diversus TaxID=327109 RepID=UPI002409CAB9|nr:protein SSUH2 homolog [Uloborus diversus]